MRAWTVGIALAATLATTAVANDRTLLRSWTLAGPAGESGSVRIDISVRKKQSGRWRFYEVRFKDLPMECAGGPSTFDFNGGATGVTTDSRDHDSFGLAVIGRNEQGERAYSWSYSGELSSRHTAEGFVRARGTEMPLEGGGKDDCDTGRLEWTASTVER